MRHSQRFSTGVHTLVSRITGTDDLVEGFGARRMALVLSLFALGFIAIVVQAFYYQIVDGPGRAKAATERIEGEYEFVGNRGEIKDRSGRRTLAMNVVDYHAKFVKLEYGADPVDLAFKLADALGLDRKEVLGIVSSKRNGKVLKRHLTQVEIETLAKLDLPGVDVFETVRRFYPGGEMMGPLLGYVAETGDAKGTKKGIAGIEAAIDDELKGDSRSVGYWKGPLDKRFYRSGHPDIDNIDGHDVLLTIDARIQNILDAEIMRRVTVERAKGAMGVVLSAKTFEVLAISSVPSLDPNIFEKVCGEAVRNKVDLAENPCVNKVITYEFEPGSIGKVLTAATAYDAGKARPDDILNGGNGRCRVGKFWVTDLHRVGLVTVADAIMFSSNCALAELASRMGAKILYDGLKRFGIGTRTGLGVPGEGAGRLWPSENWHDAELKTAAYGYGYVTTVMQLATAIATIANNGVRLPLKVVKDIRQGDSSVADPVADPAIDPAGERVISEKAARWTMEAMRMVVMNDEGTGKKGRPEKYSAAGKTGTARVINGKKGYSKGRFMASFVGYAPSEDPEIVIAITLIEPQEHKTGGSAVAPVFARVVDRALPLLGVIPEVEPEMKAKVDVRMTAESWEP